MTWLDICNAALVRVGANKISALGEASQEAKCCQALLDPTVHTVLSAHPWNCATTRAALAKIGASGENGCPAWPMRHAFALPVDCLRALYLETRPPAGGAADMCGQGAAGAGRGADNTAGSPGGRQPVPFLLESYNGQRVLICATETPTLVYIGQAKTPDLLIPQLRQAVIYLLAAELATAVAEGVNRRKLFLQEYMTALEAAMLADAVEGYEMIPSDDSWLRARFGY